MLVCMIFMVLMLLHDMLSEDDPTDPRMNLREKAPLIIMILLGAVALLAS